MNVFEKAGLVLFILSCFLIEQHIGTNTVLWDLSLATVGMVTFLFCGGDKK